MIELVSTLEMKGGNQALGTQAIFPCVLFKYILPGIRICLAVKPSFEGRLGRGSGTWIAHSERKPMQFREHVGNLCQVEGKFPLYWAVAAAVVAVSSTSMLIYITVVREYSVAMVSLQPLLATRQSSLFGQHRKDRVGKIAFRGEDFLIPNLSIIRQTSINNHFCFFTNP